MELNGIAGLVEREGSHHSEAPGDAASYRRALTLMGNGLEDRGSMLNC